MVRLYRATANYDMPEDGGEGGGVGGMCTESHPLGAKFYSTGRSGML